MPTQFQRHHRTASEYSDVSSHFDLGDGRSVVPKLSSLSSMHTSQQIGPGPISLSSSRSRGPDIRNFSSNSLSQGRGDSTASFRTPKSSENAFRCGLHVSLINCSSANILHSLLAGLQSAPPITDMALADAILSKPLSGAPNIQLYQTRSLEMQIKKSSSKFWASRTISQDLTSNNYVQRERLCALGTRSIRRLR
jgi:hypothetical protein